TFGFQSARHGKIDAVAFFLRDEFQFISAVEKINAVEEYFPPAGLSFESGTAEGDHRRFCKFNDCILVRHFHSRYRLIVANQLVCQLVRQPVARAVIFVAFGGLFRIQSLQDCEQSTVLYYDTHAATSILPRNALTSSITRSHGSIVLCASITLTGE